MKELSIEEKAKRYDEALELAKDYFKANQRLGELEENDILSDIFPELKESKDERVRNQIINFIEEHGNPIHCEWQKDWIAWLEKQSTPQVRTGLEWVNTIDDACDKRYAEEYAHGEYCHEQSFKWGFQEGVDWLEKQGESMEINPTEFDTRLQSLIGKFDSLPKEELIGSLSFWLNVVQNDGTYKADEKKGEQKPAEWSEEDEKCIKLSTDIIDSALRAGFCVQLDRDRCVDWLKSLRPQKQWKPTEAQLASLTIACDRNDRIGFDLTQLLKELKKL